MANRHRNDFIKVTEGRYSGKRLIDIAIVNPKFILEYNEKYPGAASIELVEYCRDEVLLNNILITQDGKGA
jgi:hypothetical protein